MVPWPLLVWGNSAGGPLGRKGRRWLGSGVVNLDRDELPDSARLEPMVSHHLNLI